MNSVVSCQIRPEVLNVDNPVQAGGAARGTKSDGYRNYVVVQLLPELCVCRRYLSTPSYASGLHGVIHIQDLRSYLAHIIGNIIFSNTIFNYSLVNYIILNVYSLLSIQYFYNFARFQLTF